MILFNVNEEYFKMVLNFIIFEYTVKESSCQD